MILIECEQGTEQWHAARAGVCTASRFEDACSRVGELTPQQQAYVAAKLSGKSDADAKALAGYKTAPSSESISQALAGKPVGKASDAAIRYASLLALERIAGQPLESKFSTWQMERGRQSEPVARAAYMAATGYIVDESGIALTDDCLFGYSTDGEVYSRQGGVEIKVPSDPTKVAGVWIDPAPVVAEYLAQCQGGMWIRGWKWVDLVIYTPWLVNVGRELFIQRIYRDDEYIEEMESGLMRFIRLSQHFEAELRGEPPPPWIDGGDVPKVDLAGLILEPTL